MRYLSRRLRRHGPIALALGAAGAAVALTGVTIALAGSFSRSAHGRSASLPRGCGSCHVGHGAPRSTMLPGSEADTCLLCHGAGAGRTAARAKRLLVRGETLANLAAAFNKPSRHRLGEKYKAGASTVSCSDCHHPHYMEPAPKKGTRDVNRLKQRGDSRGRSASAYNTCYRCHGAGSLAVSGREEIERLLKPANPSFHPVEARGRNSDVPSLVAPYDERSYVACTDCHGNSESSGAGGPHGSTYAPILKAHFQREDGHSEAAFEYALCYRCHNRSVVLGSRSFEGHKRHVVDQKTSCHTCHDSHGSRQYPHLIDFDKKTVFANSTGRLAYRSTGVRRGECSLRCHGKDHDREAYGGPANGD